MAKKKANKMTLDFHPVDQLAGKHRFRLGNPLLHGRRCGNRQRRSRHQQRGEAQQGCNESALHEATLSQHSGHNTTCEWMHPYADDKDNDGLGDFWSSHKARGGRG